MDICQSVRHFPYCLSIAGHGEAKYNPGVTERQTNILIHIFGEFKVASWPNPYVFWLQEKDYTDSSQRCQIIHIWSKSYIKVASSLFLESNVLLFFILFGACGRYMLALYAAKPLQIYC